MKINQMEYFAQVCRLGTITRAAKELHVSQPSVTAAIHEMEKELGVSLFYRRNNKLYLTEEGNFVLDRVVDILKDVERLDRDLKGFVGTKNLIRLGVPLQIGACLLPLLFGKFRKMNPEVKLEIQESGAMDIVRSLLEDQLDMAIVSVDISRQWDVSWTPLYQSEFCFCVAAGHPQSSLDSITFEEACRQPLVAFKEGFYVNGVRRNAGDSAAHRAASYRQESGSPWRLRGVSAEGGGSDGPADPAGSHESAHARADRSHRPPGQARVQ